MSERPPRQPGLEIVVSPEDEREYEAIVTLLQRLPDPEPPVGLTGRIMDAVAAQEAESRGRFRRMAPWAGTALAAGLATLAVFTTTSGGPFSFDTLEPAVPLVPSVARPVATATTAGAREDALRRPAPSATAPVVVAGRAPRFFGAASSGTLPNLDGRPMTLDTAHLMERRLDHEINHLLLDPPSFFERLGRRRDRDRLVAQIAERAAQRGDAVEVALQLRQRAPGHPDGARMTEALLRSVIEQHSARR